MFGIFSLFGESEIQKGIRRGVDNLRRERIRRESELEGELEEAFVARVQRAANAERRALDAEHAALKARQDTVAASELKLRLQNAALKTKGGRKVAQQVALAELALLLTQREKLLRELQEQDTEEASAEEAADALFGGPEPLS